MSHVLVVDDSELDRRLAGALLESGTGRFVRYASDGLEALEQMEASLPVLVVSDLNMPNLDGMRLVESIRRRFPHVPTIVMTAHGSERIAVQALLAGAADFVPKLKMAAELLPAARSVLEIAAGDRFGQRASDCLQYQELRYELENDLVLAASVVEQFRQIAGLLSLIDPAESIRLAKALMEAMANAVYHGNLELSFEDAALGAASEVAVRRRNDPPHRDRRLHVRATFSRQEAAFTIRDEGPGFDVARHLPDVTAEPSRLNELAGRGLVLIRLFMDDVRFNATGSEIHMVKRARRGAAA